jgi:hypothetical protein
MEFIEMSGKTLLRIAAHIGPSPDQLKELGVTKDSIVRINRNGDIELRRADQWDIIGGMIGEYETLMRKETGLDWARSGSDEP